MGAGASKTQANSTPETAKPSDSKTPKSPSKVVDASKTVSEAVKASQPAAAQEKGGVASKGAAVDDKADVEAPETPYTVEMTAEAAAVSTMDSLLDHAQDAASSWAGGGVPEIEPFWAQALAQFEAENDHEMDMECGEPIIIIGAGEGGWYWGTVGDKLGLVPQTYVRPLELRPAVCTVQFASASDDERTFLQLEPNDVVGILATHEREDGTKFAYVMKAPWNDMAVGPDYVPLEHLEMASPSEVVHPISQTDICEVGEIALDLGQRVWMLPPGPGVSRDSGWCEVVSTDARRGYAPINYLKDVDLWDDMASQGVAPPAHVTFAAGIDSPASAGADRRTSRPGSARSGAADGGHGRSHRTTSAAEVAALAAAEKAAEKARVEATQAAAKAQEAVAALEAAEKEAKGEATRAGEAEAPPEPAREANLNPDPDPDPDPDP